MKTYSGSDAGSLIEPIFWNAKKSVWVISPWLGKKYAEQLATLSQKGIEVRIITSNQDYNIESLEILKASENPNLLLLILRKEKPDVKPTFVHAKIYIADNERAISGSANLTYSGLHSNVESLSIAETKEEVQQIEMEFRRIWMEFENKSMSKEELSSGTSYSIKNALPLSHTIENTSNPNIAGKELIYHPYYFFEFIFRGSVRSPPLDFRDSGFVVLDGMTRQIINDERLVEEINNNPKADYVLKTENKYRLTILKPIIRNYQEANELALDYIITKNTRHYTQYYQSSGAMHSGSRGYDRLFVPRPYDVRFVKSDFVQIPLWYVDMRKSGERKLQKIVFGSSEKLWDTLLYCPECQRKIWIKQAIQCQNCGKEVCPNCIKEVGFVFKKKICKSCLPK